MKRTISIAVLLSLLSFACLQAEEGVVFVELKGDPNRFRANSLTFAVFSPDGKRVATASWDGTARIWDIESRQEIQRLNGGEQLFSVAFSPNGKKVAAASSEGIARIWDANSGKGLKVINNSQLQTTLDWNFDLQKDEEREIEIGQIHSVAFSPDGERIVIASQDGTVKIWNLEMLLKQPVRPAVLDF